jgi:hypothetical protein
VATRTYAAKSNPRSSRSGRREVLVVDAAVLGSIAADQEEGSGADFSGRTLLHYRIREDRPGRHGTRLPGFLCCTDEFLVDDATVACAT